MRANKRVIRTDPDVLAGVPLGAALARKNIAGEHDLTAKFLHAETPARTVAAVA